MRWLSFADLRQKLSGTGAASGPVLPETRPSGPLLWCHFGRNVEREGARIVLDALREAHPRLTVVSTGLPDEPPPADSAAAARAFLDAWRPDVALFVGSDPFPEIWSEALSRAIPLYACEIDPSRLKPAAMHCLENFDAVLVPETSNWTAPAAMPLGRLSKVAASPDVDPVRFEEMADRLAGRPMWLAHDVDAGEVGEILIAHHRAAKMSHRLTLLLCAPIEAAEEVLSQGGWRWSRDVEEGPLAPDTQILLISSPCEAGLWVRIAPITFLGGSLAGRGPSMSPYVPASLGSAVVCGPVIGSHAEAISRLQAGRAISRIGDAERLGTEVERLLNSDVTAGLAAAGWVVTSKGAEASARLFELLDDTLAGVPM